MSGTEHGLIEFDPEKDVINLAKHGMSLGLATEFVFVTAQIWVDEREDYGEQRLIASGYIGSRIHILVFTRRSGKVRAISLRKANRKEVRSYVEQRQKLGADGSVG